MITHLSIRQLVVVEHLELSFNAGMTVLTGETGAGKSILIDALGLTLGERAESGIVRSGADTCEVSLIYDLKSLPKVCAWLSEMDLASELESEAELTIEAELTSEAKASDSCIIRRIITKDGRSRAYINGKPVPLQQLRELGEQLVNIHGQHQHQSLLKAEHQRLLLDEYANHTECCYETRQAYLEWQKLCKEQLILLEQQGQNDRLTLLQYQIQEIEELNLQENELQTLEQTHKQLAHAEHWLSICEHALSCLKNESGNESGMDAFSAIYQSMTQIATLKTETSQLKSCHELLSNALIQLEEGIAELQHFKESVSIDPERLNEIDKRLSQIHATARKHRVQPEQILEHQQKLMAEANLLTSVQKNLEEIAKKIATAEQHYLQVAKKLKASRKKFAAQLEQQITKNLPILEMQHGHFKIDIKDKLEVTDNFSASGLEDIEFLVTTNPGQPLQPLRKIVSGGELSRISLAIQVITAEKMTTPTLIFDEVDVGISGKTAETVGKLLRKLSKSTQVLCVTHLPQVAAQGEHHYKVEKHQTKERTTTEIKSLSPEQKIQEIARLLGGANITKHALAHAEEMLSH